MILRNQNEELKRKLNKLEEEQAADAQRPYTPVLLLENKSNIYEDSY